jgi:enoyl-CoA hydratase/carnithine racemase
MPEYFLIESDGPVTTITFNRPEKRNGLNGPVMAELEELIHGVRDGDRSTRALILTGAGSTFCAGADPTAVTGGGPPSDPGAKPANPRVVGRIFDAIAHLDVMTIGAINGHAIGGGWAFALAVDYCVAVPEAQFWVPEVDLGVAFRGLSSFALTARMGPWLAKEAAILCRRFSAEELRDLRIVNQVVSAEELMPTARRMAAEFASKAPKAATATKRDINSVVYAPRHY